MNDDKLSYSMFIDDHQKPLLHKKQVFKYVEPKNIYTWVDDTSVTKCYQCGCNFSFFLRKHHCRNCGRIFCYHCCNYWEKHEDLKLSKPHKIYGNYWNATQKVCGNCYTKINKYRKIKPLILTLQLVSLDIKDYQTISQVCKKWYQVAMHYFSNFREIQYKLVNNNLEKWEINILRNNIRYFSKHSKWLLVILKSLEHPSYRNSQDEIMQVLKIMDLPKKCSCWNLMCSRSCKPYLEIEDIIICLSFQLPNIIKNKLIQYLHKITNSELSCYMMILLQILSTTDNIAQDTLALFLIQRAKISKEISHILYWNINHYLSSSNNYQIFFDFQQMFFSDNPYLESMCLQHKFVDTIIHTLHDFKKINLVLEEYFTKNSVFPAITNPGLVMQKMLVSKIKIKNSSSRPILIPCEVITSQDKKLYYEMLYKNDDLRKEKIIMDIIILMDKILKKELDLDLHITTYNIVPVNEKQGFIEIIPHANTLYRIKKNGFTIQNYILEHNTHRSLQEIRERFTKSCAAYCIISYMLGIGDRHLENIMITKSGLLFHIDYGFILGYDPKFIAPEIRITPEMVDALGGIESNYYKKFQTLCTQAYNCLRRHSNIFLVMLSLLYKLDPSIDNGKFTSEYIKTQILKRFIPNDNYQDAKLKFITKVNNSYQSNYSFSIIDYFHKGKEDISIIEDANTEKSYGSQIIDFLFTSE